MKRPDEIRINQFHLNILLNDKQKEDFNFLLNNSVYCYQCGGTCLKGVNVNEIRLNPFNDITVHGTCKVCNGKVCRTMEFGEDKEFYNKAMLFRKSIDN